MGCQWSGEKADFHTLHAGALNIDPVEEHLHLKAWRDPAMRQRMLQTGPSSEAHDIIAIQESLAFQIHLMKSSDEERPGETLGASMSCQQQQQNLNAIEPKDPRQAKLAELEAEQDRRKIEQLKALDAGCWQQMAEQGLFQKAEDLLTSAAEYEESTVGRTERYAMLMHSLGALYDFRSNVDVVGQQQQLSLASSRFAERAVQALRSLMAQKGDGVCRSEKTRLSELLAESLLVRGKSLCNAALDGDCQDTTADTAFDDAEKDIKDASAIREELAHEQLAEAVMAIGYVHYCRACRVLQHKDDNSVVNKIEYMEQRYAKALEYYQRSLDLYMEGWGNEHTDVIRMRCNIALVYNVMSRMPCKDRLHYICESEKQYQLVLRIQQKVFGKRHQRTQRIELDLKDVAQRKAKIEAGEESLAKLQNLSGLTAEQMEDAERERKAQADKLMQEFLEARRKERSSKS